MAGLSDLVGVLMQGGLTRSGSNRVGTALGRGGLGQSGGLLEQMMGGSSGGGGLLGGLMDAAQDMMGGKGQSSFGSNPLATGGLGAAGGGLVRWRLRIGKRRPRRWCYGDARWLGVPSIQ